MGNEFDDCLKRGRIREFSQGAALALKEFRTARRDHAEAMESLAAGKSKWATIQAYYAMFHASRALLYAENYREKGHFCLIVAIRALYVDKERLPAAYVELLQRAKELRENADYYDDWSSICARELVEGAADFLARVEELLQGTGLV
jgi:uncharacterized protein (UPF0332 family)